MYKYIIYMLTTDSYYWDGSTIDASIFRHLVPPPSCQGGLEMMNHGSSEANSIEVPPKLWIKLMKNFTNWFWKDVFKKKRNFWISDMDGVRIFVFGNFTWLFRSSGTWTIFQAQDLKIAGRMCWQRCRYNGAGPVTSWEWLLGRLV